jgi:cytochrome c5
MIKKTITLCSLVTLSIIMVNCSSTKKTTAIPGASNASPEAKVAEAKKNYNDAQMAEGKTLWESNCAKCHKLFTPESRDVEKWEAVLPRMVKRAKLSDQQAGMVRAYLITNAKG